MTASNILILMADQLAPHFTSTYGHPVVKTPNIDQIAEKGCRFDAAYTPSPLCAPARFSFMAGQAPFEIRAYDNAAEFPSSIPTFCHYLRALGYHTCLSGKMHFVGADQLHGFSERLTTDIYPADFAWTPDWKKASQRIDVWYHNMSSVHEAGPAEMTYQLEYDDEVGFHGIRKIYDYAQRTEQLPFAMVASFTHPHDPYVARQKWWDLYESAQIDMPNIAAGSIPSDPHSKRVLAGIQVDTDPPDEQSIYNARRAYYANVTYFDDWVGQFVDALRKTKLINNTVIFVISDHGDMLGERGLWYKMNFFEHAARIPMIACGPGIANSTVPNSCTLVDMLPTLVDLAGESNITKPELLPQIQGKSLLPLLGGDIVEDDRVIFSQYASECAAKPMVMLRRGNYKFVHCDYDPPMMFKLDDDPLELENIATDPDHHQAADSFSEYINEHWDLSAVYEDVIESQQNRFLIYRSSLGKNMVKWDHQPDYDASDAYIRSARELDDMASVSRYPPWRKSTD